MAHLTESPQPLVTLLEDSIRRGYWRVAVLRFFMLNARDVEVPDSARFYCEDALPRLKPRELEQMRSRAAAWARMVRGRDRWVLD